MRVAMFAVILLLAGCDHLTNEEIVAQNKICREAGMDTRMIFNGLTYGIREVQCWPKP